MKRKGYKRKLRGRDQIRIEKGKRKLEVGQRGQRDQNKGRKGKKKTKIMVERPERRP